MASFASSSAPGPSVEDRLAKLHSELDKLKKQAREQAGLLQSINNSGEKSWDLLNQDLRSLGEDFANAKEAGEDFTEATFVQFKDVANTHGNFGNRLCALEIKVKKMLAKYEGK